MRIKLNKGKNLHLWKTSMEKRGLYVKVKVDTGARTSALHAFFVDPFTRDEQEWVRFGIHPIQQNSRYAIECEMPVKDRRVVSDSGGHREERYIIETTLQMGVHTWSSELTLTDRDSMRFRMLLGRKALEDRFLVNPAASYKIGKKPARKK